MTRLLMLPEPTHFLGYQFLGYQREAFAGQSSRNIHLPRPKVVASLRARLPSWPPPNRRDWQPAGGSGALNAPKPRAGAVSLARGLQTMGSIFAAAWHGFCTAAGRRQAMTKDVLVICAGMLAVGVGVWTFWGHPQSTKPARTEVVRILADDPALKLASETSPYMRTER